MLDRALSIADSKQRDVLLKGNKPGDRDKKKFNNKQVMLSTTFSLEFCDINRIVQIFTYSF